MKKGVLLLIMLVAFTSIAYADIRMPVARIDDRVRAGSYVDTFVVGQAYSEKLENVYVSVFVPELYLYRSESFSKVREGDFFSQIFSFDLPKETPKGLYDVRFVISDGNNKRVKYRTFEVI